MRWLLRLVTGACVLLAVAAQAAGDAPTGSVPATGSGRVAVLWLGQSAVRVTTPGGKVILIDPAITADPATPAEWKDLAKLGHVDLILVTDGHPDHVGDAFALSKRDDAAVYAPAGLRDTVTTLGLLDPAHAPEMNKGGTVAPLGPGIAVSMVHADHSSEFTAADPSTGRLRSFPGGEPVGFVLKLENGFTIYHTGDTALFGDMKLIADLYHPDLVMIPIGGTTTMDPRAAAAALRAYLRPRWAIPMRGGTAPPTGTPEALIRAMETNTTTRIVVMRPGETRTF